MGETRPAHATIMPGLRRAVPPLHFDAPSSRNRAHLFKLIGMSLI
jgi:hypothetical protein